MPHLNDNRCWPGGTQRGRPPLLADIPPLGTLFADWAFHVASVVAPPEGDRAPLQAWKRHEQDDRRRNALAAVVMAGFAVFVLVRWEASPFANMRAFSVLIYVTDASAWAFAVYWGTLGLLPHPETVERTRFGVRLRYPRGVTKDIPWETWVLVGHLQEVTSLSFRRDLPLGSKVYLRRPFPHSFWIDDQAYARIRAAASRSRQVSELSRPGWVFWKSMTTSCWSPGGLENS